MDVPATRSERLARALAALLLLLHLAALVGLARQVPWTTDEPALLLAGRSLALGGGWETPLHRTQGPLPLLASQLFLGGMENLAPDHTEPARPRARAGMLPFSLLLLWVLWAWAKEAWGAKGALLALFLASTSPLLLGYGALIAVDMAHAALTLLTLWLFWRWQRQPGLGRLAAWAAALGLAAATKYLALLLGPVLALQLVVRQLRAGVSPGRALGAVLMAAAIGLFALHATYLFRAPLFLPDPATPLNWQPLAWLASQPLGLPLRLLPQPLVLGADFQGVAAASYSGVFLDYQGGHWAYYLAALGTKTPLGILVLLALSLVAPSGHSGTRSLLLVLLPPALVLLAILSLGSALQPGIRYALPLYPMLLLLAGGWARRSWAATRPGRLATFLLCLWVLASSALCWPYMLGYFNELTGGPKGGFRLFADSNCDWGQDHQAGRAALARRHPDLEILGPFDGPRFGTLGAYALHLKPADPERPGRTHHWIARFSPIDRFGAAWLVFRVTPEKFEFAARASERAARELALAWIEAGDLARARDALGLADPEAAAPLRRLLELLGALERDPSDAGSRRQALGLLSAFGLADRALELLRNADPDNQLELLFLLYRSGRHAETLELLASRSGSLPPPLALLLSVGRYQAGDLPGALNALERNSAPRAESPFAPLWDAFKSHLLEIAEKVRKLEPPNRPSNEAR